ncbi:MAG: hypothetical protein ACLUS6_00685 [Dysosmobacter sp.]
MVRTPALCWAPWASGGPVDYTVVQGRVTVRGGHLVTVEEEKLAREAEAASAAPICQRFDAREPPRGAAPFRLARTVLFSP